MIIRKTFKFEAAHIVRNCSTERCKKNIHGHSFIVEVFLKSTKLDNAGMVVDFSLLKPYIGKFIDLFDHTYIFWNQESLDFKEKIKSISDRWISLPFSPSAEQFALMFHFWIQRIIENTRFYNREGEVSVHSVRVHETATGYAETEPKDPFLDIMLGTPLTEYEFSSELQQEGFREIFDSLVHEKKFHNPIVNRQI